MVNQSLSGPMASGAMQSRSSARMIEACRITAAAGVIGLFGLTADFVVAQPEKAAAKAARQHELDAVRAEQRKNAETEAKLRAEIEAIGEDRRKLNDALIGTATRLRAAEERIGAVETRLKALENN